MTRALPVVLEGEHAQSRGLTLVRTLAPGERLKRVWASTGLGVLAATWVSFVPSVGFALSAALVGLGIAVSAWGYHLAAWITGLGGPCPDCARRVHVGQRPLRWPVELECPHCHAHLLARPWQGSLRVEPGLRRAEPYSISPDIPR